MVSSYDPAMDFVKQMVVDYMVYEDITWPDIIFLYLHELYMV